MDMGWRKLGEFLVLYLTNVWVIALCQWAAG